VEGRPIARGAARAAIDDQVLGVLRHFRIQVVVQHPQGGFLVPALAGKARSARSPYRRSAHGNYGWRVARAGVDPEPVQAVAVSPKLRSADASSPKLSNTVYSLVIVRTSDTFPCAFTSLTFPPALVAEA